MLSAHHLCLSACPHAVSLSMQSIIPCAHSYGTVLTRAWSMGGVRDADAWHMCGAGLGCSLPVRATAAAGLQLRQHSSRHTHTAKPHMHEPAHGMSCTRVPLCSGNVAGLCRVVDSWLLPAELCQRPIHLALRHWWQFSAPAGRPPAHPEHQLTSQEDSLYLAKIANGTTALAGWCLPPAHYSSRFHTQLCRQVLAPHVPCLRQLARIVAVEVQQRLSPAR